MKYLVILVSACLMISSAAAQTFSSQPSIETHENVVARANQNGYAWVAAAQVPGDLSAWTRIVFVGDETYIQGKTKKIKAVVDYDIPSEGEVVIPASPQNKVYVGAAILNESNNYVVLEKSGDPDGVRGPIYIPVPPNAQAGSFDVESKHIPRLSGNYRAMAIFWVRTVGSGVSGISKARIKKAEVKYVQ